MPRNRVNFGAAAVAALFTLGCSPNSSTPRASAASSDTGAAKAATASSTADPIVAAADRGRIAGTADAKTWFIIASDFQCPYCRQWHDETYRLFIDEYVRSGKMRVAYINFPLAQHKNAVPTAEAAMCAGAQQKFWEYHDELFITQQLWTEMADPRPHLDRIATSVGVDLDKWRKCMDSDALLPLIFADRDRAAKGGVQSTPSFMVNGQVIPGAQRLETLRPVIEAAIARSGGTSPQ